MMPSSSLSPDAKRGMGGSRDALRKDDLGTGGDRTSDDEQALVQRAMARDRYAFACLYDRHVHRIYRYFACCTRARSQAEDLTAQVFLKAWASIAEYHWIGRAFSAWLLQIAHNIAVDHFRQWSEVTSLDGRAAPADLQADFEAVTLGEVTAKELRNAIVRLTPDQQQVILLRFVEGMPTEQVAEIMGRQLGTVQTLQYRALVSLERILRRQTETPPLHIPQC